MKQIKVAITDDHLMVIKGVRMMLEECRGIEVCDTYNNGAALLAGLKIRQPDVLLIDITMPGITGDELTKQIAAGWPAIGIIALTNSDQPYHIHKMLDNGALGYLLKNADHPVLDQAIRTVHEGRQFIDPGLREILLQDMLTQRKKASAVPVLTEREQDILQLIGANHTSQEIADKLFVSKHTIDHYRISLLAKFEVKNASGLIKKAIDLGLIR